MDENDFRKRSDQALTSLKQALITAEESADFEVEDQAGALHVSFEDGGRFVISPNAPVRQIWVSARVKSFKLDWDEARGAFVLPADGRTLLQLIADVVGEQMGEVVSL